jgi:succinate dehydrogenase/fumarate reductase flavoprotein subunit
MDMTHFTPDQFDLVRNVIPIVIKNFEANGYDLKKDHIEYVPDSRITTVSGGGVQTDADGASSIPGLFAAGDSSDYARATTGSPLSSCAVTGYRAGGGAGRFAISASHKTPVNTQIKELEKKINEPLGRKGGISFNSLYGDILRITEEDVGIFMHGDRLSEGVEKMKNINAETVHTLSAKDPHELAKVHGLVNMAEVLELMMHAFIFRQESRGGFVRDDFPEIDNINWLNWVITKRDEEGPSISADPIPIDDYPLKPKREKVLHPIYKE